ncbi:MAG: ROK family protein [Clostridia bacterium]|nr:ROK family protein [Clostridia bacterium]
MYRLGLDIGGTKINIGVLNKKNQLIATKKLLVSAISNAAKDIKQAVLDLCNKKEIPFDRFICCGVGVPGTVSADGKTLIKAPNIAVLSPDFATLLEAELGIPVTMVQDSRAAAWGEYLCGGGKGAKTLICITLGTGIGTGLVIDGAIYHGALGAAGELGHVPVVENGRPCGCGKRGCMEKYCAGGGLDITARELLGDNATAHDLFQAARNGNQAAKAEIDLAVSRLGNVLVGAVNLLSPDCILFSGGMSEQTELYLEPLIDYVKVRCYSTGKLPRMEKAALGEFSPLVGAALIQADAH